MLIAQISDMHLKGEGELLYGRIDTTGFLERAVAHVNALDPRPDIVLATGDLVNDGGPEQYANLRRVLAPLAMPVFMIPGNHDARDAMRQAFPEHDYLPADGFLQYTVEGLPVRLIALDTLVDGKGHGELCEVRLKWLEARLAESNRPTLLFMHHPPFECGISYLDTHGLNEGGQRLSELVRAHGNVERVMCGHVHRPIQVRWAGTMASIAPSTAHQATLDLRPGVSLSMKMEPPGIALHQWREGTGLVTHVSYVGNYDGPQPFRAMSRLGDLFKRVGPGVITGAADDDPSGIATYSQAGAQFGLNMLWTVVLTWPLMVAVQSVSARIGRVTGRGLAANFAEVLPRPLVGVLVALLFIANTVNIGADLSAMGAAAHLVLGGNRHFFTIGFAIVSLLAVVLVPYHSYVGYLKWLTFSLFAYVGVVFTVHIDWPAVLGSIVAPRFAISGESLTMVVAIFGTTISPYLFFWQSSEEVEEEEADPAAGPLIDHPEQAPRELTRIGWETWLGMGFSNLVAFFIILTTAVTLNASGQTDIQTSEQAAAALKPIAGEWSFMLFSIGIIGTGMLAIPVLAGSAGYAVGEIRGWRTGLERTPRDAVPFYAVIAAAIVAGVAIDFTPLDPMKALFWSAVLNGVITVPIIAAMLIVASRPKQMGAFVASPGQRILGWTTTAVMAAAAVAMFALM